MLDMVLHTYIHTSPLHHLSDLRSVLNSANMTEFNPHARVDINKVIVVDMFNTERKSLRGCR